mmetsp:Transcript_15503/g.31856  ORF Transcript_15503/g.31856 Transcript_15503/m.31856 type:complete len:109 (+) Transcript_15503:1045-1371(+)
MMDAMKRKPEEDDEEEEEKEERSRVIPLDFATPERLAEKRTAGDSKEYTAHARKQDSRHHGIPVGNAGSIEVKLCELGAVEGDRPHAVVGFVVGAFGALSCFRQHPAR